MKKKYVLIAIAVLVGIFVLQAVGQRLRESSVRNSIPTALEQFESTNDQFVASIDENLQKSSIAAGLVAKSKSDTCEQFNRYAGFSKRDTELQCYLKYLRFYETDKSVAEIDSLIAATANLRTEFDQATTRSANTDCQVLYRIDNGEGHSEVDTYGHARQSSITYVPAGSSGSDFGCEVPSQILKNQSIEFDRTLAGREDISFAQSESFDGNKFHPETSGFWFEYTVTYFRDHF